MSLLILFGNSQLKGFRSLFMPWIGGISTNPIVAGYRSPLFWMAGGNLGASGVAPVVPTAPLYPIAVSVNARGMMRGSPGV